MQGPGKGWFAAGREALNGFATCERNREACGVGLSGKEEREQEEPVLHVLQKRLETAFLQVSGLV